MVTTLTTGTRKLFSLVKFDHEPVVAFDVVDTNAALHSVVTGLTESPKALQKSALIELDGGGGNLVVIDRSERTGITDFFRDFLEVHRLRTEAEMTEGLKRALIKTVKDVADSLPNEITARVTQKLLQVADLRPDFDAEQFFGDFFGAHGTEAVRASFDQQLEAHGIGGEGFTFDRGSLPTDVAGKYRTIEGVRILVPPGARDTVTFIEGDDGSSVVTIRTRRVIEG